MIENTLLKVLFVAFLTAKETFACVNDPGQFNEEYKLVGTSIYIDCNCDSTISTGKLIWIYPNGTDVQESLLGSKSRIYAAKSDNDLLPGLDLHIPRLTLSMSGTYKCVYKDNNHIYNVKEYKVHAFESFYFLNNSTQFISLNKNSSISCEVKGGSGQFVKSWKKIRTKNKIIEDITVDEEKFIIKGDELIITNVANEDRGTYICSVFDVNTTGSEEFAIIVEVMVEPEINNITVYPDNIVVAGETLYMECIADGTPYPDISWHRIVDSEINSTGVYQKHQIIFEEITPEDQGKYECRAKNRAGEARLETEIKVLVAPKIIQFNNITEIEGNVAQLLCNATGRPEPNVTIIFLGKNEDNWEITEEHIFDNMHNFTVTPKMEGYYICNTSNEVNYTEEKMYLSVLYQPHFKKSGEIVWGWPGVSVNLSCENNANPIANLTWRYMGKRDDNEISAEDNNQVMELMIKLNKLPEQFININISHETKLYGEYECEASNDLGSERKSMRLQKGFVPYPISNVYGIIKSTEAIFQIAKPMVQGPDIIGYVAEYDENANYEVTYIHKNRTWSIDREQDGYKLEGLKPDTGYQIKFAAKNDVGIGEWGEIYNFTTSKPSAPSPPIWEAESDYLNITENQILKWKAPDENGDPIYKYIIRYCQDCRDEEETCEQITISNSILQMDTSVLRENSTYCIQLQAQNTVGISSATNVTVTTSGKLINSLPTLATGVIICISIVVVLLALLVLDVLLCMCRKQGIIAHCYYNNRSAQNDESVQIRDKKGLLKDNCEPPEDNTKKHKEFEYNKATGIITGKHSSV